MVANECPQATAGQESQASAMVEDGPFDRPEDTTLQTDLEVGIVENYYDAEDPTQIELTKVNNCVTITAVFVLFYVI